jgi:predicted flap endonuclease-1-like 5' DNA nuclease
VPAQEKLTPTEQNLAYLIGLGVTIAIVALLLIGLGTIDNTNITTSLLIIGIALIVLGAGGWLVMVRPWERFDDLKTPHYASHQAHSPEAVAEAEPAPLEEATPAAEAAAEVKPLPAEKAAPPAEASTGPDNLTLIEGIGPKSAAALNQSGITTFAQVAAMTGAELEQVVRGRGVRLVGSAETWPQQARLAAAGDLAALAEMREKLKGRG